MQQLPNQTSLDQSAIAAAEANPIFALSTETLAVSPQIWNVQYDGTIGTSATLVFAYDESQLPPGTDESLLGIWHFDKVAKAWEFGGTVDPLNNTITFATDNFSPFQLGILVPEPGTVVLAGMGLAVLAGCAWRKRRSRKS